MLIMRLEECLRIVKQHAFPKLDGGLAKLIELVVSQMMRQLGSAGRIEKDDEPSA